MAPSKTIPGNPRQAADVVSELIDDEVLLYHPTSTTAVYLSATAALVWSLCDGSRSVDEITEIIAGNFPASAGSVAADVAEALAQLQQAGVVVC